jgi:hypothetical protein
MLNFSARSLAQSMTHFTWSGLSASNGVSGNSWRTAKGAHQWRSDMSPKPSRPSPIRLRAAAQGCARDDPCIISDLMYTSQVHISKSFHHLDLRYIISPYIYRGACYLWPLEDLDVGDAVLGLAGRVGDGAELESLLRREELQRAVEARRLARDHHARLNANDMSDRIMLLSEESKSMQARSNPYGRAVWSAVKTSTCSHLALEPLRAPIDQRHHRPAREGTHGNITPPPWLHTVGIYHDHLLELVLPRGVLLRQREEHRVEPDPGLDVVQPRDHHMELTVELRVLILKRHQASGHRALGNHTSPVSPCGCYLDLAVVGFHLHPRHPLHDELSRHNSLLPPEGAGPLSQAPDGSVRGERRRLPWVSRCPSPGRGTGG